MFIKFKFHHGTGKLRIETLQEVELLAPQSLVEGSQLQKLGYAHPHPFLFHKVTENLPPQKGKGDGQEELIVGLKTC